MNFATGYANQVDVCLLSGGNSRARGFHPMYPVRVPVPDMLVPFYMPYPQYAPIDFTHPIVFGNDNTFEPNGWADPADFSLVKGSEFKSYLGPVTLDEEGKPLNPMGRTGMVGRGLLGKWGPNHAADPIVTRINSDTGYLEVILIRRADTNEWAIPGGMVDSGERISATLARELNEETSATLDFENGEIVYQGYVDDPRNTDNAWMETMAVHIHIDQEVTLQAGDDAVHVQWVPLTKETIENLYASHSELIRKTVELFKKRPEFANWSHLP